MGTLGVEELFIDDGGVGYLLLLVVPCFATHDSRVGIEPHEYLLVARTWNNNLASNWIVVGKH